jgi:hypothetical protein
MLPIFLSLAGVSLTKLSLAGNNLIIPVTSWLGTVIPLTFFYRELMEYAA